MAKLKIDTVKNGKVLFVKLNGILDEDANLNEIHPSGYGEVVFDWDGVRSINSCGIREWLKWISQMPKEVNIVFLHCSKAIVNQINMVKGFLPEGAKIRSLYVPYYCGACETATSVLFSNGNQLVEKKVIAPESATCNQCGKQAELDVVVSKYFRFLGGSNEV